MDSLNQKALKDHVIIRNNLGMFSNDIPKERAVHFGKVSVMEGVIEGKGETEQEQEHDSNDSILRIS